MEILCLIFWGATEQLSEVTTLFAFPPAMYQFSSVAQSCPTLWPHESQHARPPCPSPTPGVHSDSRPSSQWCHPAISSSVVPFSSCLQSLPASGSFPMSQLFAWGGQSIRVSALASVLPMNIQDWSPLGWTALDLLAVQGTLKSLLQHHSSKASILWHSAFFIVQLTSRHDYWKNHSFNWMDLCRQSDVCFLICCLSWS